MTRGLGWDTGTLVCGALSVLFLVSVVQIAFLIGMPWLAAIIILGSMPLVVAITEPHRHLHRLPPVWVLLSRIIAAAVIVGAVCVYIFCDLWITIVVTSSLLVLCVVYMVYRRRRISPNASAEKARVSSADDPPVEEQAPPVPDV